MLEDSKNFDDVDEAVSPLNSGGSTPTAAIPVLPSNARLPSLSSSNLAKATVADVSVEVVIAPLSRASIGRGQKPEQTAFHHNALQANMIISTWTIEDTQYFTMTFTSASHTEPLKDTRPTSRVVTRTSTGFHLNSRSRGSGSSSSSGQRSNPNSKTVTPKLQQPEFPPRGPPIKSSHDISSSASIFQKASQMKDAILNSVNMPAYGIAPLA